MALSRDELVAAFRRTHPEIDPRLVRVVRAPGRVNLIGEHTDYNGGLVLPMAIDLEIAIAFASGPGAAPARDVVDLTLEATGERRTIAIGAGAAAVGDWTDYVAGTARALAATGAEVSAFAGVLAADLPAGAGLSSSAALELASAWALAGGHAPLPRPLEVAIACRRAENEFVGVPCGLMDQFAAACGRAGSALLLDCRSLDHRPIALPPEAAFLIVDSGVRRDLRSSAYADRQADVARAAATLNDIDPSVVSLRDATPALLDEARGNLDDAAYRRARHVLSENDRVLVTVAALEAGDLEAVGRALLASHASLRDDVEVSTPELDRLVEIAQAAPGAYGARLTGAGFGGAVIALVRDTAAAAAAAAIRAEYRTPSGEPPEVRRVRSADGAGVLDGDPARTAA